MNLLRESLKETGREYVYGSFGINDSGKSDGWHSDIEAVIAEFEASNLCSGYSKNTCEKPR